MDFPRLVALIHLEKFQVEEVGFANPPYVFDFDIALPRPTVVDQSRQLIVDKPTTC